jgi:hypothetical protein
LLENELRARDVQLRELLNEMGRSEARGAALRHEVDALRQGAKILPEHAGAFFGLRRITLGRGTGGLDDDTLPGDEALAIFIEPRDTDEHIIKVPGSRLTVHVVEINHQGLKFPFCAWEFDPEKTRQSWRESLISTGYYLKIPWKDFPRMENLRVIVRMILPDERVFEADKDIKVRLVPGKSVSPVFPVPPEMGPPPKLMPDAAPELGPPPALLPGPELAPPPGAAPARHWQPTGRPKAAVQPPGRWEPAPLYEAIKLGRPLIADLPP